MSKIYVNLITNSDQEEFTRTVQSYVDKYHIENILYSHCAAFNAFTYSALILYSLKAETLK
jgi:hypothetical protein